MRIRRSALLVAAATLAVTSAGCGGAASATPSAPAASSAAGGPIAVELKEWSVTPASATANAGPITFAITNTGTGVHEFVVVKTDIKADALPVVDNKIDESSLTPVDEVEDIAVGATPSLEVQLEAGHYVLLCNIESHYGQGMRADFDVK